MHIPTKPSTGQYPGSIAHCCGQHAPQQQAGCVPCTAVPRPVCVLAHAGVPHVRCSTGPSSAAAAEHVHPWRPGVWAQEGARVWVSSAVHVWVELHKEPLSFFYHSSSLAGLCSDTKQSSLHFGQDIATRHALVWRAEEALTRGALSSILRDVLPLLVSQSILWLTFPIYHTGGNAGFVRGHAPFSIPHPHAIH